MRCPVCQSDRFFEDESGAFICSVCATQSQEYFAESFENDDDGIDFNGGRRTNIRSVYIKSSKRLKGDRTEAATCLELLRAYQFCLQYLAQRVQYFSGVAGLCAEVEFLWFEYLKSWQKSGKNISRYFMKSKENSSPRKKARKNDESSTDSESDDKDIIESVDEELPPTRPLMLGFIYFAARNLRSWIVPSTIVLWIQQGLLPYTNLMEIMPDDIKLPISGQDSYIFNAERHLKGYPSTSNILFHAVSLGQFLNQRLSPLNSVLVAHAFITNLGLPFQVWKKYVVISRLFSQYNPLDELKTTGNFFQTMQISSEKHIPPRHPEEIMAAVVVACKLCNGWMDWVYEEISLPDDRVVIPSCSEGLDNIPRRKLRALLDQIRQVVKHRHVANVSRNEKVGMFNDILENFIESSAEPFSPAGEVELSYTEQDLSVNAPALKINPIRCTSNAFTRQTCNPDIDEHVKRLNGGNFLNPNKKLSNYVTYVRNLDLTGTPHIQYQALLSRCALHIQTKPAILNYLVEKIETRMVLFHETLEYVDEIPEKRKKKKKKKNKVRRKKLKLSEVVESISGPSLRENSLYPSQSASTISSERNIKKLLSPIKTRSRQPSLKKFSRKPNFHRQKHFQNDLVVDLGGPNDDVMSTPISSTKSLPDSIEDSISSRTSSRRVASVVRNLLSPISDSESHVSSAASTALALKMTNKKKQSNLRSPPQKSRSAAEKIDTIKRIVSLGGVASKKQNTFKKEHNGANNVINETVWI